MRPPSTCGDTTMPLGSIEAGTSRPWGTLSARRIGAPSSDGSDS